MELLDFIKKLFNGMLYTFIVFMSFIGFSFISENNDISINFIIVMLCLFCFTFFNKMIETWISFEEWIEK